MTPSNMDGAGGRRSEVPADDDPTVDGTENARETAAEVPATAEESTDGDGSAGRFGSRGEPADADGYDDATSSTAREPAVVVSDDPDLQAVVDRYETVLRGRTREYERKLQERSADRGPLERLGRRLRRWL